MTSLLSIVTDPFLRSTHVLFVRPYSAQDCTSREKDGSFTKYGDPNIDPKILQSLIIFGGPWDPQEVPMWLLTQEFQVPAWYTFVPQSTLGAKVTHYKCTWTLWVARALYKDFDYTLNPKPSEGALDLLSPNLLPHFGSDYPPE